jgi:hypothetical protein
MSIAKKKKKMTASERDLVALRVDEGDLSVEYRGQTITVDDLPNRWVYRIDGNEFESLEAVLDDVDDRYGSVGDTLTELDLLNLRACAKAAASDEASDDAAEKFSDQANPRIVMKLIDNLLKLKYAKEPQVIVTPPALPTWCVLYSRIPTNYNPQSRLIIEAETEADAYALAKRHIGDEGKTLATYHIESAKPYEPRAVVGRVVG